MPADRLPKVIILNFLHRLKKEPHPAFDLRQSLPSLHAERGWEWGVRGLLQEVY